MQAAFAFCGADETRGKTSARRFLRLPAPRATGGCNVDMVAAQRHADRPDTPSAIQKAACTFPNGVQAAFLGVQRTCLLCRGRGSGFAVAAKGQPAFCGQCPNPICRLLFQICSKSVPSPAGEGVGLPLPPKGSLHFADNVQIQYAGCFFKFAANLSPLPRERVRVRAFSDGANFNFCMAVGLPSPQPSPTGEGVGFGCRQKAATLSVGMAAQRHADRSDSEIYSRLKLQ